MLLHAKAVLAVVIFSFLAVPVFSIQVSEIMHNPDGSDAGREWIEVYNNDSVQHNLTGWKVNTDNSDHSLNVPPANGGQGSMILEPGGYAIIVQNATAFLLNYNFTGTVIDSSWSDLSNSENKTIWVKNSTNIFDNVTYFAVSEGNTSCLVNGTFTACLPTPGAANSMQNETGSSNSENQADVRISLRISAAAVNTTYTSLFQLNIDNKTCSYADNVTISYNITPSFSGSFTKEMVCSANTSTGDWTPAAAGNYTICGVITSTTTNDTNTSNNEVCGNVAVSQSQRICNTAVSITSDSIANSSTTLEYALVLTDSFCNETSVEVEYWIENLFGSYAKEKLNTTQEFSCSKTVSRQWTPDSITGSEAYKIKAYLRTNCSDVNVSDNSMEKLVVVKGSQAAGSSSSSASSSSSGSSSSVAAVANASKKSVDVISYPMKIYVGERFETVVNVSVGNFSIYSYVYSGQIPVSEWNGSHSWDANKKELNTNGIVSLFNIIENGTTPGNYTMKVRLKADNDEDTIRVIEVLGRPKLAVEKINGSVILSACEGCELLIIGDGFEFYGVNYTLEKPGMYSVLLLKDGKIFSRERIAIEAAKEPAGGTRVTGLSTARNRTMKVDKSRLAMLRLLSAVKLF